MALSLKSGSLLISLEQAQTSAEHWSLGETDLFKSQPLSARILTTSFRPRPTASPSDVKLSSEQHIPRGRARALDEHLEEAYAVELDDKVQGQWPTSG